MILKLKAILGSMLAALDVIYVIEGNKEVSRISIDEKNKEFFTFLQENGIDHSISDFKILRHIDSTRGFSDKGKTTDIKDPKEGKIFVYISKDSKKAKRAKEAEKKQDHIELGKLLGYPECCCNRFADNAKETEKKTNDHLPNTFRNSHGFIFPWQNNYCLRGFDISTISHFPCGFECEESKRIAESNLRVIEKHNPDITNYFRNTLKSAVIYSEGIGVYSLNRFSLYMGTITYHPEHIAASCKNEFRELLIKNKKMTVLGKNKFVIGRTLVEDDHTFLGIFR